MGRALPHMIRSALQYWRDQSGNATMLTAIAAIPMIASIGVALDYERASKAAQGIQVVADGAVLAAAAATNISGTPSELRTKRQDIAVAYLNDALPKISDISLNSSPVVVASDSSIDITVKATVEGSFIGVLNAVDRSTRVMGEDPNTQSINDGTPLTLSSEITAVSRAGWKDSGSPRCITALDPSASSAFYLDSSSSLDASTCDVNVVSNASVAAKIVSASSTKFKKICVKGGTQGSLTGLDDYCNAGGDAYANFVPAVTVPATCNASNTTLTNTTITPPASGYVFCGDVTLAGGATTTLNPGLYIVKDGKLNMTGKTIHGTGVSFYFASETASLGYVAKEDSYLKAPTSGTYKGWLMFMQPGMALKNVKIGSADKSFFEGIMYLPSWNLTMDSTSDWGTNKVNMVVNKFSSISMSKLTWQPYSTTFPDGSGGGSRTVFLK